MTYTRVRVTFLHFFAIFIQMGGWNGKNGGKKGIYYIYTMYIYAEWRRFALSYGYPMGILWLSYGEGSTLAGETLDSVSVLRSLCFLNQFDQEHAYPVNQYARKEYRQRTSDSV